MKYQLRQQGPDLSMAHRAIRLLTRAWGKEEIRHQRLHTAFHCRTYSVPISPATAALEVYRPTP